MNFRKTAASYILSSGSEDIENALLTLYENQDQVDIPEGVVVWEPFENYACYEIIEYIENLEELLITAYMEGVESVTKNN